MRVVSTFSCAASTSYAAITSPRLSSRVTVSYCERVCAWPRKSNVRHAQPISASLCARSPYCCWLPPQPWTNSTPGISVRGETSVPAMCWSPTWMSTSSSRVGMRLDAAVLGEKSRAGVDVTKIHGRVAGRRRRLAVDLGRGRVHGGQRRIGLECPQRRDFGAARTTDAPRLLEHARPRSPARVGPLHHVVIATRGEKPRK